ncbi:MAG: hypothetical protein Kow0090_06200 [Myxococcota bacterium]
MLRKFISFFGKEWFLSLVAIGSLFALSTCMQGDVFAVSQPIANAGPDREGALGDTFILDGKGSISPSGEPLIYIWRVVRKPKGEGEVTAGLSQSSQTSPEATVSPNTAGTWVFELKVKTESGAESLPDYVTVRVKESSEGNAAPGGCDPKEGGCQPPPAGSGNRPPIVSLRTNRADNTFFAGQIVIVYSEASDPDGDDIEFTWEKVEGPEIELSDFNSATTTFTAPEAQSDEIQITLRLTVDDGKRDGKVSAQITIKVAKKGKNQPPVAVTEERVEAPPHSLVILDGSRSYDPDGDDLSYSWRQKKDRSDYEVILDSTNTARARFYSQEKGTLEFELTVYDVTKEPEPSKPANIQVVVKDVVGAPVADAGADKRVNPGQKVCLDGTGSFDPDDSPGNGELGPLLYSWALIGSYSLPVTLENADTATPCFIAPSFDMKTSVVIELIVYDGQLYSQPDTVTVTVVVNNTPPTADAGIDMKALVGDIVILDGGGSTDNEGDRLYFDWKQTDGANVELHLAGPIAWFTADAVGKYEFSLTVDDALLSSKPDTVAVEVVSSLQNKRPIAKAGNDVVAQPGTKINLDGSGSYDPDQKEGEKLTYHWTQIYGIETKMDKLSVFTEKPSVYLPENPGVLGFMLVVSDGEMTSYPDIVHVLMRKPDANTKPVAMAGESFTVKVGSIATLNGSGSYDPDGHRLTYLWEQKSGNAVYLINPNTPNPSFFAAKEGEFTFKLTVSDGYATSDATASSSVTVRATAGSSTIIPVAVAGNDITVNGGAQLALNGEDSYIPGGGEIFEYFWFQADGFPITLPNPKSSKLSFKAPEEFTTLIFGLVVKDKMGVSSLPDFVSVKVLPSYPNAPPVADAGDDIMAGSGATVFLDGTGSFDPNGSPLSYKWSSAGGIALVGERSATPYFISPIEPGEYEFSLVVNDGVEDSAKDSVIVTVLGGPAGNIPLVANPAKIGADITEKTTITGGPVLDSTKNLVEDGTCITVDSIDKHEFDETGTRKPKGIISSSDECPEYEGIQRKTAAGMFKFVLQAVREPGKALITADAIPPYAAHGETVVELEGGICKGNPKSPLVFTMTDSLGRETDRVTADGKSTLTFSAKELVDVVGIPVQDGVPFKVTFGENGDITDSQYFSVQGEDAYPETPEWDGFLKDKEIKFTLVSKTNVGEETVNVTSGLCTASKKVRLIPGPPSGDITCALTSGYSIVVDMTDTFSCGPVQDAYGHDVSAGYEFDIVTDGVVVASPDYNSNRVGVQVATNDTGSFAVTIKALTVAKQGSIKFSYINNPEVTSQYNIKIKAGAPHHLGVAGSLFEPQVAGEKLYEIGFTTGIRVRVFDSFNNLTDSDSTNITLSELGGTPLFGLLTKSSTDGEAVFDDISIRRAGGPYTIRATAPSLTAASSNTINIVPAAPAKLVIPTVIPSGSVLNPMPNITVQALDAFDNLCTNNSSLTVAIKGKDSGGVIFNLTGTTSKAITSGIAIYTNIESHTSGSQNVVAQATGVTEGLSNSFTMAAGPVTTLTFVNPLASPALSGLPIKDTAPSSTNFKVRAADTYDNPVEGVSIGVKRKDGSPGGAMTGTLTVSTGADGIAVFSNASTCDTVNSLTVTAYHTDTGTTKDSNTIIVNVSPGTKLVFSANIANTDVDTTLDDGSAGVTVQVKNNCDALDTGDNSTQVRLRGTDPALDITQQVAGGETKFVGVRVCTTGNNTLNASATGLTSGNSNTFVVSPGAADHLSIADIVNMNTNEVFHESGRTDFRVYLRDRCENIASGSSENVRITVTGVATDGGTLTRPTSSGIATFNDITTCQTNTGVTVTADVPAKPALGDVTTPGFDITDGGAYKLVFAANMQDVNVDQTLRIQGQSDVRVQVRDRCDNLETSPDYNVTVSGLAMTGTTTRGTAGTGIAIFDDLMTCQTGVGKTLTASATGLQSGISSAFTVSVGADERIRLVAQPKNITVDEVIQSASAPNIQVEVVDRCYNRTGNTGNNIEMTANFPPLSGTTTRATAAGVATFDDLRTCTLTSSFQITATYLPGGLTVNSVQSNSFTVSRGAPADLDFRDILTTPRVHTQDLREVGYSSGFRVDATDVCGNYAAGSVSIELKDAGDGSTYASDGGGATTRPLSSGTATFSNISPPPAAAGRTIRVRAYSGAIEVPSSDVVITN